MTLKETFKLFLLFIVTYSRVNAQCDSVDTHLYSKIISNISNNTILLNADSLIKQNPECWYGYNIKGYYLYENKQFIESEKYLEKAYTLNNQSDKIKLNLINVLTELEKTDKALEMLNIEISKKPNDERFITNRGLIYKDIGNFILAYKDLKKANKLISDNVTNFNLGLLYYEDNKEKKSIKYFKKALHYNNYDIKSIDYLIIIYTTLGKEKQKSLLEQQKIKIINGEDLNSH